jgi:hypothetical protein
MILRSKERFIIVSLFFFCLSQDVRPSVRESDTEAKALLQMAGKTLHREGVVDNIDETWDKKTNEKKE